MKNLNQIEYTVYGKNALFTDPLTKTGGEKFSYPVPTYQALKGITESIYWKPTLIWMIDEVRIMNVIETKSEGIRPIKYAGGNDLATYTYLKDVEYHVKAHFIWNDNREDLAKDRNEDKHFQIARRMIDRGGRRDIFLGTRECQAYVEPCDFSKDIGAYDNTSLSFGLMFHGFTYPDEANRDIDKEKLTARFWNVTMENGVIRFPKPEECSVERVLGTMQMKIFDKNNFSGLEEFQGGEYFELDSDVK